jgi:hypothetical protein
MNWKQHEVIVAYFQELSRNLSGEIEENDAKPESG